VSLLAFALEIFLSAPRLHDDPDGLATGIDEKFIRAGLDGGNGRGLGKRPARVVRIRSADCVDAFVRIVAVGAMNNGDNSAAERSGHEAATVMQHSGVSE
jgi:hypothetical protein